VVVLAVGIIVTAILVAGLVVLIRHASIGEQRTERLAAGLVQVTAAPSRLLSAGRPSWRARVRRGHGQESPAPSPEPASEPRGRRRRRRGPAVEDPAEVERLVRDQLYGRQGRGG
jgi:hypothetical protein